jgi:hypothetical protein
MNKTLRNAVLAGWIGVMGWATGGQAVQADGQGSAPQITVYVYNWADVEPDALRKAREVAARIFQSAGVEARVLEFPLPSDNGKGSVEEETFSPLLTFIAHIYTREMARRFRLPQTMLGLAPGTPEDQNRTTVYVFDHVAAHMAQEQAMARVSNIVSFSADKGQILGHGIVHEIGHVLLHQASHPPVGLMRANWDRNDLQNMVLGELGFTAHEAERMRAEVRRRNGE